MHFKCSKVSSHHLLVFWSRKFRDKEESRVTRKKRLVSNRRKNKNRHYCLFRTTSIQSTPSHQTSSTSILIVSSRPWPGLQSGVSLLKPCRQLSPELHLTNTSPIPTSSICPPKRYWARHTNYESPRYSLRCFWNISRLSYLLGESFHLHQHHSH